MGFCAFVQNGTDKAFGIYTRRGSDAGGYFVLADIATPISAPATPRLKD